MKRHGPNIGAASEYDSLMLMKNLWKFLKESKNLIRQGNYSYEDVVSE